MAHLSSMHVFSEASPTEFEGSYFQVCSLRGLRKLAVVCIQAITLTYFTITMFLELLPI